MAIGFMAALKDCGIDVPGKVSVAGIDDIPISGIISPALSTVHIDRELIGEMAVDELIGRLLGNLRRTLKPMIHDSCFIMRDSVAVAKER